MHNSTIEQLYQAIRQLSDEVEHLIDSKNEENCTNLLAKRHALLEQLAQQVAETINSAQAEQVNTTYIAFLKTIQSRDNKYLNDILQQQKILSSERTKQVKSSKAIKAYHNLM